MTQKLFFMICAYSEYTRDMCIYCYEISEYHRKYIDIFLEMIGYESFSGYNVTESMTTFSVGYLDTDTIESLVKILFNVKLEYGLIFSDEQFDGILKVIDCNKCIGEASKICYDQYPFDFECECVKNYGKDLYLRININSAQYGNSVELYKIKQHQHKYISEFIEMYYLDKSTVCVPNNSHHKLYIEPFDTDILINDPNVLLPLATNVHYNGELPLENINRIMKIINCPKCREMYKLNNLTENPLKLNCSHSTYIEETTKRLYFIIQNAYHGNEFFKCFPIREDQSDIMIDFCDMDNKFEHMSIQYVDSGSLNVLSDFDVANEEPFMGIHIYKNYMSGKVINVIDKIIDCDICQKLMNKGEIFDSTYNLDLLKCKHIGWVPTLREIAAKICNKYSIQPIFYLKR